ncbi:hypothetical protein AKJ09_07904 [Labilithrix luteola]|uniref:Uncharacterized protein n=1 Tax=Labilithrix luteola TaxID=1391654 RepID=A0A0K1Q605_9BACT|nr:hypothetical protein AKJ09_07904 [Labilithrix luteola]
MKSSGTRGFRAIVGNTMIGSPPFVWPIVIAIVASRIVRDLIGGVFCLLAHT